MPVTTIPEAQTLGTSPLIELYELDTSALTDIYGQGGTGTVYHWVCGTISPVPVIFNGVQYLPMPIEATGFEWSGQGKLPQPKLRIANLSGLATGLIVQFGDMLGATVTRIRTHECYLDGFPQADPEMQYEPDVFRLDRKSAQNKAFVEFELAAAIDQMGVRLPKRQVLQDACSYTYRKWANGSWYAGTCPYAGDARFDAGDQLVSDNILDVCSHRMTGCLVRYGLGSPLPFGGFPGCDQVAAG